MPKAGFKGNKGEGYYDSLDVECKLQGWRSWNEVATEAARLGMELRTKASPPSGNASMLMCYNIGRRALFKLAQTIAQKMGRSPDDETLALVARSMDFQKMVREAMLAPVECNDGNN